MCVLAACMHVLLLSAAADRCRRLSLVECLWIVAARHFNLQHTVVLALGLLREHELLLLQSPLFIRRPLLVCNLVSQVRPVLVTCSLQSFAPCLLDTSVFVDLNKQFLTFDEALVLETLVLAKLVFDLLPACPQHFTHQLLAGKALPFYSFQLTLPLALRLLLKKGVAFLLPLLFHTAHLCNVLAVLKRLFLKPALLRPFGISVVAVLGKRFFKNPEVQRHLLLKLLLQAPRVHATILCQLLPRGLLPPSVLCLFALTLHHVQLRLFLHEFGLLCFEQIIKLLSALQVGKLPPENLKGLCVELRPLGCITLLARHLF
eukprot:Opistho-2@49455